MRLINRDHIQNWANRYDAKGNFPILISRLIRSTTTYDTNCNFPSGSAAFVGGWDGIVNCSKGTPFVPQGLSLWELGTDKNFKSKADRDFEKRTKNPLGYDIKNSTYIFVTPKFWMDKEKWMLSKKAQSDWKDVIVYDSSSLEQWLELTLAVSRWFSADIGIYPSDGIMTAEEYWEEWSTGNGIILNPKIITSGREAEIENLNKTLNGEPTIKGVKASTKNEAIAFIVAAAISFREDLNERFFAKTLLIDTEGNYRAIRYNAQTALNLIPRFEDIQSLYIAVTKGNHVLVPLGADDDFNQETIILPTIERGGQIEALIECGFSDEEARKYSREAGRNITILKKILGFLDPKAKWIESENLDIIIPALLVGRWNEEITGDVQILEELYGQPYSKISNILSKWLKFEESPLIKIGRTWRLTSPLDIWTNISNYLSENDFKNLSNKFFEVFEHRPPSEINLDAPFSYFQKPDYYSGWLKEGLVQSLILIANFGENLNFINLNNSQEWVDVRIKKLLDVAKGEDWVYYSKHLPLLAEASPKEFLNAVSSSLNKEDQPVMELFKETEGFFQKDSSHSHLLWALEGLAWMPEYLPEVTKILFILSINDPGGGLSNRPFNSLMEIYKPWHYQTLAPLEPRMESLKNAVLLKKEIGWNLLIAMLPSNHGIAHPTFKMRWRLFNNNLNLKYTYQEIYKTYSFILELLLKIFDFNEQQFSKLIEKSPQIPRDDRNKFLKWAYDTVDKIPQTEFNSWHAVRKILYRHRSNPNADWSLQESVLKKYERLYNKLKPKNMLQQNIWLFEEHWLEFPEGYEIKEGMSHNNQYKLIQKQRIKALRRIIDAIGLEETINLRKAVKQRWALGESMGFIVNQDFEIIQICRTLSDSDNNLEFFHTFIRTKYFNKGLKWVIHYYEKSRVQKLTNTEIHYARFFIPLPQETKIWDFLSNQNPSIEEEYWKNISPNFHNLSSEEITIGLGNLIKHERYVSSLEQASRFVENIESKLLIEILRNAIKSTPNETKKINEYDVDCIFKTLHERTDIPSNVLIDLEWIYLPLLDGHITTRIPLNLHKELTENPEFFIEVISIIYKRENDKKLLTSEISESKKIQARHAWILLKSWKNVPGSDQNNKINYKVLEKWVLKSRRKAKEIDRLSVSDMHIGEILAQYPERKSNWPEKNIFKIIEKINSNSLNQNYSTGLFNKRSFSSRGAFDGGDIERGHADYFQDLYFQTKNDFPTVSKIFKDLASGYLRDAKIRDEEAEREKFEN